MAISDDLKQLVADAKSLLDHVPDEVKSHVAGAADLLERVLRAGSETTAPTTEAPTTEAPAETTAPVESSVLADPEASAGG